jgi:hypothetical protein
MSIYPPGKENKLNELYFNIGYVNYIYYLIIFLLRGL